MLFSYTSCRYGSGHDLFPQATNQAAPWELTDQQREFIVNDRVRHVLIMGLESTETAVRWNNKLQALAENTGFGIPANNSSDPRHGAGSSAEYMGITGESISKWANGIGLSASFDPALVKEFGEIASAEYRALGIATALSPQIDRNSSAQDFALAAKSWAELLRNVSFQH